ncbi:MAG: three-Cys-motif partner protein TcmP [Bacteroidia bacterium]
MTKQSNKKDKPWGGPWTEKKLDAFISYVQEYLKIMKDKYWKLIYFDGFAGSGERIEYETEGIKPFFLTEEQKIYEGAAERVVKLDPPHVFNYYYFIDLKENNISKLKAKINSLEEAKGKKLEFRAGDCNEQILKLAQVLRTKEYAALIFIDPFGMHIEWEAISSLKNTRSDIWILLPTAVIINRLLDKNCELKSIATLTRYFGLSEDEIISTFYRKSKIQSLFGEDERIEKVLDPIEKIAEVYIRQLGTIWKFVTQPLRLNNRKGAPLFHLIFASNNETALRIASHIIAKKRR